MTLELNRIYNMDCLEGMKLIPDKSIDMILCDLPYGITSCKWDTVIPFDLLWKQYKRIIKDDGAIVLTASQPFTTTLINSNIKDFKYCWYWYKNMPSGFQLAKIQPMRVMEEIAVFYTKQPTYNRQPTESKIKDRKRVAGAKNGSSVNHKNDHRLGTKPRPLVFNEYVSPRNVLEIPCVPRSKGTLHPTQKPVDLFAYLIRTYTNEGDVVLDNCMGSGTTAVAAQNTGRFFIGFETDEEYYRIANERIKQTSDVE